MKYLNVVDVRIASGIPESLATDDAIEHAIEIVESLTERAMNTKFYPALNIEVLDGTGTDRLFLSKNPVLRLEQLKTDENEIDISDVFLYRESGKVMLGSDSDVSIFLAKNQSVMAKYRYGFMVSDDSALTALTSDVSAGTDVSASVADASKFAVNDWIDIFGVDGKREAAKITAISGNTLTFDFLGMNHSSGSMIIKLETPSFVKRFIELESVIYVGMNAIGATYTFNASYSIGDLSVTKGVPYTHWRESLQQAVKEREQLRNMIKPRFAIRV